MKSSVSKIKSLLFTSDFISAKQTSVKVVLHIKKLSTVYIHTNTTTPPSYSHQPHTSTNRTFTSEAPSTFRRSSTVAVKRKHTHKKCVTTIKNCNKTTCDFKYGQGCWKQYKYINFSKLMYSTNIVHIWHLSHS